MNYIDEKKKYLVALSGGPDSVYLTDYLAGTLKLRNIIVATVNYNFRTDSHIDESVTRELCRKYKLEHYVIQTKWNGEGNFEAWAREMRYQWFRELVRQQNLDGVIIAHNQNDAVETYLMQIDRDIIPETYGLKAIQNYNGLVIYRPMLNLTKSFIMQSLHERSIKYAFDSTNADTSFKRNELRAKLEESDFAKYLAEMELRNTQLAAEQLAAQKYVANFIDANKCLQITSDFTDANDNVKRLTLVKFFKEIDFFPMISATKHSILGEIVKRLSTSNKKYWEIKVKNHYIIYDFGAFWVQNKSLNDEKTLFLTINEFKNDPLYNQIDDKLRVKSDLIVRNDYLNYKRNPLRGNKTVAKVFGEKKIPYAKRFAMVVIMDPKTEQILQTIPDYK